MIGHLYTLLLVHRGLPEADRFDYTQVLLRPQQGLPAGLARMAAHIQLVRRARQQRRR